MCIQMCKRLRSWMCELCGICGCVFRCVRDGVHGCVNCVESVDVYSDV